MPADKQSPNNHCGRSGGVPEAIEMWAQMAEASLTLTPHILCRTRRVNKFPGSTGNIIIRRRFAYTFGKMVGDTRQLAILWR